MMSLVSSLRRAQAGGVQTQVAATILKSNADTEKSAVPDAAWVLASKRPSLANVAAGIGGNLDVTA